MKFYSVLISACLCVLISACSTNENKADFNAQSKLDVSSFIKDSVFLNSQNCLRNFPSGTQIEKILQNETISNIEKENDFLLFSNNGSSFPASFSVAYTFASNQLEETEIRIETDEDSLADKLMPVVIQYLQSLYGKADSDQGITVFHIPNDSSRLISVSDNSSEGHTSLSILYYQEK